MTRTRLTWVLLATSTLLLTACAAGHNELAAAGTGSVAGFWQGLWHGVISPIAFLVSLFNQHVGVYEVHNDGPWYDFGFLLGVMVVFSGGGAGSRQAAPTPSRWRDRRSRGRS